MSYFVVIIIFEVFLFIGFFASLSYGQNFGWILLIISLSLMIILCIL